MVKLNIGESVNRRAIGRGCCAACGERDADFLVSGTER
jgi:hypothetical protein